MPLDLAVVVPVFNEEESISHVLREWIPALRKQTDDFRVITIDDGSRDGTLKILNELAIEFSPFIEVLHQSNRGHGQTCIEGYRKAIQLDARWIFQIDSDGQCDPAFFARFWECRSRAPLVFGYRNQRDDGFQRFLISRVLAVACWVAYGVWVRDPNVPYRLMAATSLQPVLPLVPPNFHLANVLVSLLLREREKMCWVDMRFRDRLGGSPSVRLSAFALHGWRLIAHLLKLRRLGSQT